MGLLSLFEVLKPGALREGDTIAMVSPSSSPEPEYFDLAKAKLRAAGYKIREGKSARQKLKYFAGSDEERAEDFNSAILDETVSAVFASRGGYGCSRILPLVNYSAVKIYPKIILGGSDFTALLWAVHQRTGLVTFFAPMALQIGEGLDQNSHNSLENAIKGKIAGDFKFPPRHRPYVIKSGQAQGRLIGGCLSLIVSLLGTEYLGDIKGRILFLEEIGEAPYRIDRMLTHLKNAGVFNRISGLILGDFHRCWRRNDESFTLSEMVEQVTRGTEFPIMAGLPFGHGKLKMTLPLGVKAEINADEGRLTFLENAVLQND